ncbi:NAD(P)-dependent oxidoreductase [Gryllotalpicola protaetiae]|uniref:Hydroxyacid dehydrogenase n=1 Tax=Gryllotalpicola protaetiae TaxID=2419771 RepID=A0A387BSW6_9MICO|nr:NAD(P)-dependent oxidoreductase [Gryllotalpicola protaetiae]AYG04126.1 hydroxyacid dehydrogenase [Gryllotalpicola protaetiae]
MPHEILVIGDSYMNAALFVDALQQHGLEADATTVTITDSPTWPTDGLSEFEGDPAEVSALIDGHRIVAFHGAPVSRRVIEENPSIELLGCARGGPVNVDLAAAAERDVAVTTTPGKNAAAVADLTIGFLIDLLRNVPASVRDAERRRDSDLPLVESTFDGARWFGFELKGRRLGLVGLGNVARLVAERALALGLEVLAFDPYVPAGSVAGVTRVDSVDDLLPQVDIVSLHARATAENRHLIGAEQFAALRRGAFFINTARESLVDESALLDAVRSGHLGGAAMDVAETDGPWRELLAEPNVILTPHIAGATFETLQRGAQMLADEILAFTTGGELKWLR